VKPPDRTYNPKRRIAAETDPEELAQLAQEVRYSGNPYHKRNPGDFDLSPPSSPRRDKTLCDGAGIIKREEAQELLERGIQKGLISKQRHGRFPQNVWAVTDDGIALEAQLENKTQGVYHGYPMQQGDPFSEEVLRQWNQT